VRFHMSPWVKRRVYQRNAW